MSKQLSSALTTLVSLAAIILLGYIAWVVLSKVAPVVGLLVLVVWQFFNLKNLFKAQKTMTPKPNKVFFQEMVDHAQSAELPEGGKPSEEQAKGFVVVILLAFWSTYAIRLAAVLLYTLNPEYQVFPVNILNLAMTVLYVLSTLKVGGLLFNLLAKPEETPATSGMLRKLFGKVTLIGEIVWILGIFLIASGIL